MLPDGDPRHGTVAGYRAGCTEECCRRAVNRYNQLRKLARDRGQRIVPSVGTRRRVQALAALGWSHAEVARRLGYNPTFLAATIRENARVRLTTVEAVKKVYDELSMSLPSTNTPAERMSVRRTQRLAQRKGWLPPLAYDDDRIDDPDYHPAAKHANDFNRTSENFNHKSTGEYDVDEAVVLRVLAGENLPTTRSERVEITRRWIAAGGSEAELCRRMKWRSGRYAPRSVDGTGKPERTERNAS